jgi:aldehyde dehydrogenase (NAD+)
VLADFKYTPLATYSFSENNDFHLKIESNTKSGSFVQNSVMTQIMSVDAPFGGVLESGLGRARGMEGYKSFSYLKTLVKRSSKIDFSFLYPPYKVDIKWLKKGMR